MPLVYDFWLPRRLQELHLALLGRIVTTELPNLVPPRHIDDCYAIHVFHENFVICSNQVTKIFRSGHDCTSTSSARSPRYFCLLLLATPLVIQFLRGSKGLLSSTNFLWTPAAGPASHAIDRFVLLRNLDFYFCFWFLSVCAAGFTVAPHSYFHFFRYWFYGVSSDVKNGILWGRWWRSTCVRCRGTRRQTRDYEWHIVWYIAINSLAFFGEMWFLTAGPMVHLPIILTELPERKNCGSFFKKQNRHE